MLVREDSSREAIGLGWLSKTGRGIMSREMDVKPIFHMTHIRNLPLIVKYGGLLCDARLDEIGDKPVSIAYNDIKERRARKPVTCGRGGMVADYVPFYFAPRSPMLYTINRGNVAHYTGDQSDIVHLVASIASIVDAGLDFVFTDGHPVIAVTSFFDDLGDLGKVDWPLMESKYWHDTADDPDRKRRRQAEFLVRDFFPWALVDYIAVRNQTAAKLVSETVDLSSGRPSVILKPGWYYD